MSGRSVGALLWTTMFAAMVAALVSVFVFVQSGERAQAQDQHHDGRIIGGTAVPDGKYKFVAALLNVNFGSTEFQQQFCGGALIDRDSVLTAAHCVEGESASALRVTVGKTVLDSNQGQKRAVSSIFIHPKWNNSTSAHDAAVLKLKSSVSGIAPVKLATSSQDFLEEPGRNATVAGWGNTIAQPDPGGNSFPTRMREAQVPLVSDNEAASVYANYVKSVMVAAGKKGKDTCQRYRQELWIGVP